MCTEWSNTSDFDRQYKLLRLSDSGLSTYILIANNNGQVVVKIRKEKGHSNNSHHMLFLRRTTHYAGVDPTRGKEERENSETRSISMEDSRIND